MLSSKSSIKNYFLVISFENLKKKLTKIENDDEVDRE